MGVQIVKYGEVAFEPTISGVPVGPFTKNSTRDTAPSGSLALAARTMGLLAATLVALVGETSEMRGAPGAPGLTVTVAAVEVRLLPAVSVATAKTL